MDEAAARKNYGWLGYQPPLKSLIPETLVDEGFIPDYLSSAAITDDDYNIGQQPIQLEPAVEKMWLDAFAAAKS